MVSSSRPHSRIRCALHQYGLGRCSVSGGQIWLGSPPNAHHGRGPLEAIPEAPRSLLFVEGPEQADLVAALMASPEATTVEHLMISTSHDFVRPEHPTPYDMSGAVAALAGATMPALKRLSLGDMEKLFNGHGYYGRLGEVTHVFEAAPNLEKLDLNGCFSVSRPVKHERLESLIVIVDEIGVSGGPLGQETVTHILSSRFPNLRECQMALDEEDVPPYDIPDIFSAREGYPSLKAFSMARLGPDAEARLTAFKAKYNLRW